MKTKQLCVSNSQVSIFFDYTDFDEENQFTRLWVKCNNNIVDTCISVINGSIELHHTVGDDVEVYYLKEILKNEK